MTQTSPNPSPEPNNRRLISPRSLLILGGTLVALGTGTYLGLRYFVYQNLSSVLTSQLSKLLQREVRVGAVQDFRLNHLRLGASNIPATPTDADSFSIQAIDVKFNPLPLLIGRPLTLDILLVDPDIYLDQDKNGQWVNIDLGSGAKQQLPFNYDIKVQVQDGDVALKPQAATKPITIAADGQGRYIKTKTQEIQYDLDALILNNKFKAEGVSVLETGKNQLNLVIKELNLAQLLSLFPQLPVQLKQGSLGADLSLNLPSFAQIEETQGTGDLVLKNWIAQTQFFKDPLKINTELSLEGQSVKVKTGNVAIGKSKAQLQGGIDWQTGYDLKIGIMQLDLADFLRNIAIKSPVKLSANFKSQINLTGKLDQPLFTGKIENIKPVVLDKIPFKIVQTDFQTDLEQLKVKNFRSLPTVGGEIIGSGSLKIGVLSALKNQQPIDPKKMLINAQFKTVVPTQKLLSPYVSFPQDVQVGELQANLKVSGSWAKPEGVLKWLAPNNTLANKMGISGAGEVQLVKDTLLFRDTRLQAGQGTLFFNGFGDLKKEAWRGELMAQQFPLDPFLGIVCDRSPNTCSYLKISQPVTLETLNVNLSGQFKQIAPETINGVANLALKTRNGNLSLTSQVKQGNFTAYTIASGLSLNPFLDLPMVVDVAQGKVNLSGSISPLLKGSFAQLQATANLGLLVDRQPLAINGQLNGGQLQATARTNGLNLSPLLPNLTVPVSLSRSQVNISASLEQLQQKDLITVLNNVTGSGDVQLLVDNNLVKTKTLVNRGKVQAIAKSRSFSLNQFLPNLSFPVEALNTEVNLGGTTTDIFNLIGQKTPNLSGFTVTANSQLAMAQGRVKVRANLSNNDWQSQVNVTSLNPEILLQQKSGLSPINGQASLTGNLRDLFSENSSLPINVQSLAFNSGENKITAQGNVLVTEPLKNLDIKSLNLNLTGNSDLEKLPLQRALTLVPVDRVFLPELDITGVGQFQGQIIGKNLISNPRQAGNLQLNGDIRLANFTFNDRAFEPLLTGRVKATLGQKIALDLYGQEDVIAAAIEPCTRSDCLFPYLPLSLELKQTANTQAPLLVQGKRYGDRFRASIEQFPLEVLKIAPGQNYNLLGVISGTLKAEADIDLFNLGGTGQIRIDRPGLGQVRADRFQAAVIYQNNIARLNSGTLNFGRSQYDAEGKLNFKTGEIQAKVDVNEAYIEDILHTFQITTVDRLLTLLQLRETEYATAKEIQPQPISVGNGNADLGQQVNLLTIISRRIRELASKLDSGSIPTELDMRGRYTAQIALDGTLKNPQLQTRFDGSNWQWYAQQPFPDIVNPLGLVMREVQFIPINVIALDASFQDGNIAIEKAKLQIREALAEFNGNLSLAKNSAQFRLSNLSIDEVRNYVPLPLDLSGYLNAQGTLTGSIFNPKVQGDFAFLQGAINARSFEEDIRGFFDYTNSRFQVQTATTPALQFYASVPYPAIPDVNDRFEVRGKLGTSALKLVRAFTQGQIDWLEGEGEVILNATGNIDTTKELKFKNVVADGVVTLNNASLKTSAFPEVLTVNGRLRLTPESLSVEQLEGTIENSQVFVTGVLPFFQPIKNNLNPLTVSLTNSQIELDNLYKGGINGEIIVTGTAFNPKAPPLIGGGVALERGQVFIPKTDQQRPDNQAIALSLSNQWLGNLENRGAGIAPEFHNFQVSLKNLKVSQAPLYEFGFGGEIVLNGKLNNLDNLVANGQVKLQQGRFGFLNTRFVLNRRHNNVIVFDPDQSLLNPDVDIQMRSIISDSSATSTSVLAQQRGELSNEIPDNSLTRVQRIDVTLSLQGQLDQLLPNLRQDAAKVCSYRPSDLPIPTEAEILANQQRVLSCLQRIASASPIPEQQLVTSSVVKLTSSPPRSEGEIVRLLGEQIFIFAESFQGKNSAQLLQEGVIGLAVPLLLQGYIYDIENGIADTINATDFNILPNLQAVYRVSSEGFVRLSYDYNFNEVTVRYETRF